MKKLEELLKEVYIKSHKNEYATRSTERLKQLHGFVQESIEKSTDKLIISQNMSTASKEYKLNGELGDKKIDIAIFKDRNSTMEDLESAISVKFVFSNYIQNATNYLEQMIAESLNITLSDKKVTI